MGRIALLLILPLVLSAAAATDTPPGMGLPDDGVELSFTRGDTRAGDRVRIRVVGDSLQYLRTEYSPERPALVSSRRAPLDPVRKLALKRIMGELPRYRVFGSCFGKGMRYYLIDTPAGRLYRSLPELSARCFAEEPGIFTLFEDLDAFLAPPALPPAPDFSPSAS